MADGGELGRHGGIIAGGGCVRAGYNNHCGVGSQNMTSKGKKERRHRTAWGWVLAGVAIAIGMAAIYFRAVRLGYDPEHLRNIILLVGGIVGLAIAARRARAADKQAEATHKQAEEQSRQVENVSKQIEISEQGQITERFTRAIEQLGSDKLFLRVGAIAALERIGHDSQNDVLTVLNLLSRFVRENRSTTETDYVRASTSPVPLDIQESVFALSRLARQYDSFLEKEKLRIDLSGTQLSYMKPPENACLTHFDFANSDLVGGQFFNIECNGTRFKGANLTGADFSGGKFLHANFSSANLANARFTTADLSKARFIEANLAKACFSHSTLDCVSFREADMAKVNLFSSHCNDTSFIQSKGITTEMLSDIRFREETPPVNLPDGIQLPNPVFNP